jgi:hypothetical protein
VLRLLHLCSRSSTCRVGHLNLVDLVCGCTPVQACCTVWCSRESSECRTSASSTPSRTTWRGGRATPQWPPSSAAAQGPLPGQATPCRHPPAPALGAQQPLGVPTRCCQPSPSTASVLEVPARQATACRHLAVHYSTASCVPGVPHPAAGRCLAALRVRCRQGRSSPASISMLRFTFSSAAIRTPAFCSHPQLVHPSKATGHPWAGHLGSNPPAATWPAVPLRSSHQGQLHPPASAVGAVGRGSAGTCAMLPSWLSVPD